MHWLGLDLSPDNSVEDLLRGRPDGMDRRPSSVDWFLKTDSWPKDAIACQRSEPYAVEDKMEILLKKLDTEAVEKILGYEFKEKSFIIQALTHSSYSSNKLTDSYERLEVNYLNFVLKFLDLLKFCFECLCLLLKIKKYWSDWCLYTNIFLL